MFWLQTQSLDVCLRMFVSIEQTYEKLVLAGTPHSKSRLHTPISDSTLQVWTSSLGSTLQSPDSTLQVRTPHSKCRLHTPKQGSKLSVKLQESDGLISTENLGVRPSILKSPKLSKMKHKNKVYVITILTTYFSFQMLFTNIFALLELCTFKKGSAISVSFVVQ